MNRFLIVLSLSALSISANAALVGNGIFTTDTSTGLDWLDLSETGGLSYSEALANNNGWRLAMNTEIESLFSIAFDGYYPTTGGDTSVSTQSPYADQWIDVENWQLLFGLSYEQGHVTTSLGLYRDEDSIWRLTGVSAWGPEQFGGAGNQIWGMEHQGNFASSAEIGIPNYGIFLVRSSVVPIPPTVWLFGSALGLLGWARRKRT